MIDVFCGNASAVIVDLNCNSIINYRNTDVYLVWCCLAFKTDVLDCIGKKVDDSSDDEF